VKIKEEKVTFWVHIFIALLVAGCWFLSHGWELMNQTSMAMALVGAPLAGFMAFILLRFSEGMKYGCALKLAIMVLIFTSVVFVLMVQMVLERM